MLNNLERKENPVVKNSPKNQIHNWSQLASSEACVEASEPELVAALSRAFSQASDIQEFALQTRNRLGPILRASAPMSDVKNGPEPISICALTEHANRISGVLEDIRSILTDIDARLAI
jgi:hypothetical protein